MLCAKEDRGAMRWDGRCPDCGGCIDDNCGGSCGQKRFCGGTYGWMQWDLGGAESEVCNRRPEKVDDLVPTPTGDKLIMVRCNGDAGHDGGHSKYPRTVGY